MGLCNVYSYLNDSKIGKTIKLSDSYQVRIRLEDWDFAKSDVLANKNKYALNMEIPDNNEIELFECTSVTLPSYKTKEDIFTYGNNSKSFIYMDPTSLDDLEIELIEHYNSENTLTVEGLVNLFLTKLFDEDKFEYILNEYIPELTVYVFSNIFDTVYLKYIFKELKLTDYSKYALDYSSTDIAKWTLKFSYRSFYVIAGEEEEYRKELIDNADNVPNVDTETDAEETAPEPEPMGNESPLTEPDIPASEPPLPTNDETTEHPTEGSTPPPDPTNTSLQDEFNSAGGVPTGSAQTNENVEQTSGDDNPVDLDALSPEDRTDELAYRMMRGQLDNGKPRYGKTYEAGYTEEERAKAQNIVNELDWEGLKERHDARVANMLNTEAEAVGQEEPLPVQNDAVANQEEPEPTQEEQYETDAEEPKNTKRTLLTYSNSQYDFIKENMSVDDLLTKSSNNKSGNYTATVASVYMNNDNRLGNGKIAGKDFVSESTVNEINESGKAKAELINIKASNVDELKESLAKLNEDSKNDNSLYVIGVDASNMSGITKAIATKVGGEQVETLIKEGYVIPIYKGNVGEGVGDADNGMAIAGTSIDEHSFIANRVLNSGIEIKAMKITKIEEKTEENSERPKKKYYDDDSPKYVSGMESKNGLTLNQWAYISAKQDYESEKDDKKRNSEGYRGSNFSVGIMQVPMKEKMNYQQKYHEEMKLLQN